MISHTFSTRLGSLAQDSGDSYAAGATQQELIEAMAVETLKECRNNVRSRSDEEKASITSTVKTPTYEYRVLRSKLDYGDMNKIRGFLLDRLTTWVGSGSFVR